MTFPKYCFNLLLFIFCFHTPYAQEVFIGKESPYSSYSGNFEIVGKLQDRIFVYHSTNSEHLLDAYDEKMNLKATIVLDFFPKEVKQTKFLAINDGILVFFSTIEKGKAILYGAVLNEKGLLKGKIITLNEEKTSFWGNKNDYFQILISEDKSQITVASKNDAKKSIVVQLKSYTQDLTLKEDRKIEIEKGEIGEWIDFNFAQISNSGKVLVPAFNTTNKGSITDVTVINFDVTGNHYSNISVMEKSDYFSDIILKLDNKNQLCYLAAYYKEKNNGNVKGNLLATIDLENGGLKQMQKNDFSEEFLKSHDKKNWKKAFNHQKIFQLIVKQDGGYILVSEEQIMVLRDNYTNAYMGYYSYYYNPGLSNNVREYTYGDIALMSYNAAGQMLWSEWIRKKQFSQDDEGAFSSFGFMNTGANLIMLYNIFGNKNNTVNVAAIDNKGMLQTTIINQFILDNAWYLRGAAQIENRAIMIPFFSKHEINFAKVQF